MRHNVAYHYNLRSRIRRSYLLSPASGVLVVYVAISSLNGFRREHQHLIMFDPTKTLRSHGRCRAGLGMNPKVTCAIVQY